jgi:hypothetical protein
MTADSAARPAKPLELMLGAGVLVAGVAAMVLASQIHTAIAADGLGPRAWPMLLGAAAILLGAGMVLTAAKRGLGNVDAEAPAPGGWRRVGLVTASLVGYGLAWYWLDFRLVTVVWLALVGYLLGARDWRGLLAYPVGLTAGLYLMFAVLLRIPL